MKTTIATLLAAGSIAIASAFPTYDPYAPSSGHLEVGFEGLYEVGYDKGTELIPALAFEDTNPLQIEGSAEIGSDTPFFGIGTFDYEFSWDNIEALLYGDPNTPYVICIDFHLGFEGGYSFDDGATYTYFDDYFGFHEETPVIYLGEIQFILAELEFFVGEVIAALSTLSVDNPGNVADFLDELELEFGVDVPDFFQDIGESIYYYAELGFPAGSIDFGLVDPLLTEEFDVTNAYLSAEAGIWVTLKPVPEPSTYGIFGAIALLGLITARRIRQKRAAK